MALGLVWLGIATVLLVANPWVLEMPHTSPPLIAMTHVWVLGVFLTVACGAVYQLAPVALGTTLWCPWLAWAHLAFHTLGVPGMILAFWRWNLPWLLVSGALTAVGLACFTLNTLSTVLRSGRRDVVAASLAIAGGWLVLTAAAGLFLAANHRWGWLGTDTVALLRAHAHLGLIGFFASLLQGVPFQLVAMFTLANMGDWRKAGMALALSQLGLLGLLPSLVLGRHEAAAASAALVIAGFGLSGWELVRLMAGRRKRKIEPGLRTFLVGMAAFTAALVVGISLVPEHLAWGIEPGGLSSGFYGLLMLGGGLLLCITGMMCKIVPFLTWMRAYGPHVGRRPTPAANSLGRPQVEAWSLVSEALGVAVLLVGVWTLNRPILVAGSWVLAGGVLLFLVDMGSILHHLWQPFFESSLPGERTT